MHKIIISFKEEIMKTIYFLNKITTTVFFFVLVVFLFFKIPRDSEAIRNRNATTIKITSSGQSLVFGSQVSFRQLVRGPAECDLV